MNPDAAAPRLYQHHEVVEIPVQHRGRREPLQVLHFQLQATTVHAFGFGQRHEVVQGAAPGARQAAGAQPGQVEIPAMVGRDHGNADHATLLRFRLPQHRHFAPEARAQPAQSAARTEANGSISHRQSAFDTVTTEASTRTP